MLCHVILVAMEKNKALLYYLGDLNADLKEVREEAM